VLTLILGVLGPTIADWPLALRSLVISALMVSALTWFIVPTLMRLSRRWLVVAGVRQRPVAACELGHPDRKGGERT
jgi:antibiotic biosynthesis monooxygenase (ABM) superfamily enzyme